MISVVREGAFDGGALREFFDVLEDDAPLAVQGGIDSRAASMAVTREMAVDMARRLHERFALREGETAGSALAVEGR